jgi:hypothetical protein
MYSIGAQSAPYGPARVDVYDAAGAVVSVAKTEICNHCWVSGLQPDTEYTYKVFVKEQEWASGERWDWSPASHALVQAGGRYDNRFRTTPPPGQPAADLAFAVIGDFGIGVRRHSPNRRQQQVADALRRVVDRGEVRFIITTGDNIYAGRRILGVPIGGTGDEDDDWFFTYFQPYRYVINRIPVFPSIGNHDADETEERDDRAQVEDNFYLRERLASEEAAGRASFQPGLFYRFNYGADIEFVCIDTSKEDFFRGKRLFEYPKHWEFVEQSFPADAPIRWRIPFAHHPVFSAGPQHHNTRSMQRLLPLFARAGVRVMFAGHEHNFQHSSRDGFDHFVTGAGRQGPADATGSLHRGVHGVVGHGLPFPAGADSRRSHDGVADWGPRRSGWNPGGDHPVHAAAGSTHGSDCDRAWIEWARCIALSPSP